MQTLKKIKKFISKKKYYIIVGACAIGGAYLLYKGVMPQGKIKTKEVALSDFIHGVGEGQVSNVQLKGESLLFQSQGRQFTTNLQGLSKDFIIKLLVQNKVDSFKLLSEPYFLTADIAGIIASAIVMCVSIYMMKDNIMPKKTSTTNKLPQKQTQFEDIYGHSEVKQKLRQIIDFIHNPKKYEALGARMRKGVLLYGPPGTGKTMIAKATAYQAGIDFIYTSASEFIQLFVGVGPKRIRQLFQQARKKKKGCIIFIDEFDAIGNRSQSAVNQQTERNSTINQLLTQMDGFNSTTNIVVIGATNRQHMIDPAILRAGRLDIKIKVDLPNYQQRNGIMKIHLRSKNNSLQEANINTIAELTEGFSGADLEQIVNQSAYICLRQNQSQISYDHLFQAFEEVNLKK